jgi:hypothetical protein
MTGTAVALQRNVSDIVGEYDDKLAALNEEVEAFRASVDRLGMAASIGGQYGGTFWGRSGSPSVCDKEIQRALLVSGWKAIYSRLQMDRISSAKDKQLWERQIADPPPLTLDNAVATFGDYILRARWHILRGLAETFTGLDPAYRSHSKVKIGKAALPKRVILNGVGSFQSWGRDRLVNVLNALATFQGKPLVEYREINMLDPFSGLDPRAGMVCFDGTPLKRYRDGKDEIFTPPDRGVWLKIYQNRNGHLYFGPEALADINRALAEFYGEVLPDAEGEEPGKAASTAVAKDLQFYPTPRPVIEEILSEVGIGRRDKWDALPSNPRRVLEPSCGDGRILDMIQERGHRGFGIEVHAGRAAEARAKGHAVVTANFLEQTPTGDFDLVVMNPPFYGRHYAHHVRHALKFLKPGGRLVTVLPATAWYDHGEFEGSWTDLPVASFSESGTNVPTGFLVIAPR